MSEERFEVQAVGVRMMCEEPGCEGEVIQDGGPLHTEGALGRMMKDVTFSHACNRCGKHSYHAEHYPTVRFERVR